MQAMIGIYQISISTDADKEGVRGIYGSIPQSGSRETDPRWNRDSGGQYAGRALAGMAGSRSSSCNEANSNTPGKRNEIQL